MKTRTPRATARRIDSAWFAARIAASRYGSQRQLAPHLRGRAGQPLTSAQVSLMLSGKRGMRLEEARQLADLLGEPLAEVLRHAGIDVRGPDDDLEARHRAAVRMVASLLGVIDEHGVPLPKRVREQAAAID